MAKLYLSENTRKFAREVGSVVLGVLIALGIGELADWGRWQVRAAKSNRAMDVELARAAGVMDERVMAQPCLDRRVKELSSIIRTARVTKVLPDIRQIGGPPFRPLQTAAWEDAVSSGTLLHMSDQRRSQLSLEYPLLQRHPQNVAEEYVLWATLGIIEGVPGPVSDDLLTEAATTIARLRVGSYLMGIGAKQTTDSLRAAGIRPSYFIILDREGSRSEVTNDVRSNPVCRPLVVK